jgi:tetratricopeptide (TPR) repeat protein
MKTLAHGVIQPFSPVSRRRVAVICAALFVVVTAVFLPAIRNDFVNLDDGAYVTSNPAVQGGLTLPAVKWAFTTLHFGNWMPVTWISHMVDCGRFGLSPWGHHLTSVLLHAANTVLLFLVLRRLTGSVWRSLLTAALFGLHPLRVESVAWISSRKDVLSGLFFIAAIGAYARYAERTRDIGNGGGGRIGTVVAAYLLTLTLFALGLMSKPVVVTLPFVLLLLDGGPLGRAGTTWAERRQKASRLLWEKIPFFALAAVHGVATYHAQKALGAVSDQAAAPLPLRLANAVVAYVRYLGKTFWPENLAAFYPFPASLPAAEVAGAATLLLGVTLLVVWLRRRPWLAVGWFWYLGTLVPVIQLIQVGSHAMADRFTYLPHMGLLIALVWGAGDMAGRWRRSWVWAGAAAVLLCIPLTVRQIGYWKDSEVLFRHVLAATDKNNWFAYNNLGIVRAEERRFDEAVAFFEKTLQLQPDFAEAHYNLGNVLGDTGCIDKAISQYQQAVRLKPAYVKAHYYLAVSLLARGELDNAIAHFGEALKVKPDYVEAHNDLGVALFNKGRVEDAIRHFQEALRQKPDYADARNNLAAATAAVSKP